MNMKMNVDGNKLTVLMTADAYGGVWTYALELAKALIPFGAEVHLAVFGGPLRQDQRDEVTALPGLSLYESDLSLDWRRNAWDHQEEAGKWLQELAQTIQPSLVHVNHLAFGGLTWQQPVVTVTHSCLKSWWQAVKAEPLPEGWQRYADIAQAAIRDSNVVVAPTQAMLDEAEKHYGPMKRQEVIWNGLDGSLFNPGIKESFIFAIGNYWDEGRNLRVLTDIASELSWPIYIAGPDKNPADGSTLEKENVIMLGKLSVPELREWLSRAAIYVAPAKYAPFGLCALEAALSGCTLVLGDIPTLNEVWDDSALYVDPLDNRQLLANLQMLIRNEHYREALAERAYRRSHRFTSLRMGRDYNTLYRQLVRRRQFVSAIQQSTQTQAAGFQRV